MLVVQCLSCIPYFVLSMDFMQQAQSQRETILKYVLRDTNPTPHIPCSVLRMDW
jgi:hypothetical protein